MRAVEKSVQLEIGVRGGGLGAGGNRVVLRSAGSGAAMWLTASLVDILAWLTPEPDGLTILARGEIDLLQAANFESLVVEWALAFPDADRVIFVDAELQVFVERFPAMAMEFDMIVAADQTAIMTSLGCHIYRDWVHLPSFQTLSAGACRRQRETGR